MRIVKTADCWVFDVPELMMIVGCCKSKSEGRRLIRQGAVDINGEKVFETHLNIEDGSILHVGKRFRRKLELPVLTLEVYD